MPRYLVTLAVGPVQDLIAAARRTRDLWCGSWLLSEASRAAARELHARAPGSLVFPSFEDPAMLEPLPAPGDVANVANVIRAVLNDEEAGIRQSCRAARRAASDRLGYLSREIHARHRELRQDTWNAQIDDVLEVHCAWVRIDDAGDTDASARLGAALAARKMTRTFGPARLRESGIPKSSLDGGYETVLPKDPPERMRRALALSSGEQLDALGVLKRSAGSIEQFTPYSRIAADPWLEGLGESQRARLRTAYEPLHACDLASPVRGNAGCYAALPYDAQLLFDFRLANALAVHREDPVRRDALRALEREGRAIAGEMTLAGERCGWPCPYAAIIQADGDRMGELLAHARDVVEDSRDISRALQGFADSVRERVREHRGHAIYAGGDDVLALVPLAHAIACARDLAACFRQALAPLARRLELDAEARPTLSVGIGIGHMLEPLGRLRARALRAERLAKGDALPATEQRNALGICLGIRAGDEIAWRARWSDETAQQEITRFVEGFREARLPSRIAFDLRAIDRRLAWLRDDRSEVAQGMREAEVQRTLGRARTRTRDTVAPEIVRELAARAREVPLGALADTLVVARWLAARTHAAVEARR